MKEGKGEEVGEVGEGDKGGEGDKNEEQYLFFKNSIKSSGKGQTHF